MWQIQQHGFSRDVTIELHNNFDSSYIQLETSLEDEQSVLEAEKEATLRTALAKAIAEKSSWYSSNSSDKAIDNCTKCKYTYQYRCISYIPKDVFEVINHEQ